MNIRLSWRTLTDAIMRFTNGENHGKPLIEVKPTQIISATKEDEEALHRVVVGELTPEERAKLTPSAEIIVERFRQKAVLQQKEIERLTTILKEVQYALKTAGVKMPQIEELISGVKYE